MGSAGCMMGWYISAGKKRLIVQLAFPGHPARRQNPITTDRVRFERPVPGDLSDAGMIAIDMHFHTTHSDSLVTVPDALGQARSLGIGLSITDHNQISGVLEAEEDNPGVPLIPGIEVSAADGPHILLYFYSCPELEEFYALHIEPYKRQSPYQAIHLSTPEILARSSGFRCIRAAAHPYGYMLLNRGVGRCMDHEVLPDGIIREFDAAEVICGSMNRSGNLKAAKLAERHRLGMVGGSDGHLLFDLGSVLTVARAGSIGEFLDAIQDRNNFLIGREKNALEKGLTGTAVLTRFLPYTLPSLAIHYEQNLPRIKRIWDKAGVAWNKRRLF